MNDWTVDRCILELFKTQSQTKRQLTPAAKNSNGRMGRGCSETELVGQVINLAWLAMTLVQALALFLAVTVVPSMQ